MSDFAWFDGRFYPVRYDGAPIRVARSSMPPRWWESPPAISAPIEHVVLRPLHLRLNGVDLVVHSDGAGREAIAMALHAVNAIDDMLALAAKAKTAGHPEG